MSTIAQAVSPILGSWLVFVGLASLTFLGLWAREWKVWRGE